MCCAIECFRRLAWTFRARPHRICLLPQRPVICRLAIGLFDHGGCHMPERKTIERARQAARQGKRPTTQAGEFVREEMEHIREGKHGARSTKQAIAIGLSKARRAGVKLGAPPKSAGENTRQSAAS